MLPILSLRFLFWVSALHPIVPTVQAFLHINGVRHERMSVVNTPISRPADKLLATSKLRPRRSLNVHLPTVFALHSWSLGCAASSSEMHSWPSYHRESYSESNLWRPKKASAASALTTLCSHSSRGQDIEDISSCTFESSEVSQLCVFDEAPCDIGMDDSSVLSAGNGDCTRACGVV